MRDEQVRRYARHILLPDVGGLGQTALMVASARIELRESEPLAELLVAAYLAAGGVGTILLRNASEPQMAVIAARGHDSHIVTEVSGKEPREVTLQPRPHWWPSTEGDAAALAFWRAGLAATRWMADIANR